MGLIRLAALSIAGGIARRFLSARPRRANAAFASGQGAPGNAVQIRDAGPQAMRDPGQGPWTQVDEDSDESFPASDPPGNY